MQIISCYQLFIYISIDLNQIFLTNSINDLLSLMHLILHATVRCQTVLELLKSKAFQEEFLTWRRFLDAIDQYADEKTQVNIFFSYSSLSRHSIYGYVLTRLNSILKTLWALWFRDVCLISLLHMYSLMKTILRHQVINQQMVRVYSSTLIIKIRSHQNS